MDEWAEPSSRAAKALGGAFPLIIFVAVLAIELPRTTSPGPYRIDEAHKVGETYFLLVALRGEFSHQDWFREIEQRTNPPVGKFLFGLAALALGAEIPSDLTMARAGLKSVQPPPDLGERYRPALAAARRVSVAATALTASVLCFAAWRLSGIAASVLAVALYLGNFLTQTFAATAVFDPLLTLFATLTLLPLVPLWRGSNNGFWWSCIAGGIAALAFQVRVSGLIALAVVVVTLAVLSIRRRSVRPLVLALTALVSCLLVATIINPFYWAVPDDAAVAQAMESDAPLPLRVVNRLKIQFQDQQRVLDEAQRRGGELVLSERPRFVAETALADWAGMLSLMGLLLALFFLLRSPARDRLALAFAWGLPIMLATVLLLPLAWPRYVLVMVPALALLGSLGWAALIGETIRAVRKSRSQDRLRE